MVFYRHSEMSYNMFLTLLLFIFASAWGQDGVAPAGPLDDVSKLGKPTRLDNPIGLVQKRRYVDLDSPSDYIVGGYYARDGQFPYQVSLQVSSNRFPFCGGSILTPLWILTAAHCLTPVQNTAIEILAGSTVTYSSQVRRRVIARIYVGNYRPTITDDIALLKLESSLPTNDPRIGSVLLPTQDTYPGTEGIVSGWGYNETGRNAQTHLKYLVTRTIPNDQCQSAFPNDPIGRDNICGFTRAGEGFCQGDSGGPLVNLQSYNNGRAVQIGIVSANSPCARGRPDIYTRVFPFVQAIINIVKRN